MPARKPTNGCDRLTESPASADPQVFVAIGDIHGMNTMLHDLIERLEAMQQLADALQVFLGDYVDRGDDTAGVINTLIQLRTTRPQTIFLRGNHEQLMLDACDASRRLVHTSPGMKVLDSEPMQLWLENGGRETLLSYNRNWTEPDLAHWWDWIPEEHWALLRDTLMEFITERYHFVHAGALPPGSNWDGHGLGLDHRLWIREPFLSSKSDFDGRVVVFGHSPQRHHRPLVKPNKIGLDTGAVFHGKLTAAILRSELQRRKLPAPEFVQVAWRDACAPTLPFDDE